ncbi:MAG TPA: bifunctional precorrin-2 dehydrogenase/sirohydrochlorin ferrochelatase [Kofleriaceae bacterium]
MTTPLYPVFLKLDGLSVVVVGGGEVAASKLDGLVATGAKITVVSPTIHVAIRARANLTLVEREFQPTDLDGARWVVAAATPAVNLQVSAAADARRLFVNAVDDVSSASAYLGGVIRRGDVTVAISTGGRAPGLAGLLREGLERILPDLQSWVELAATLRTEHKRDKVPMAERRPLLLRALVELYAERFDRESVRETTWEGAVS